MDKRLWKKKHLVSNIHNFAVGFWSCRNEFQKLGLSHFFMVSLHFFSDWSEVLSRLQPLVGQFVSVKVLQSLCGSVSTPPAATCSIGGLNLCSHPQPGGLWLTTVLPLKPFACKENDDILVFMVVLGSLPSWCQIQQWAATFFCCSHPHDLLLPRWAACTAT